MKMLSLFTITTLSFAIVSAKLSAEAQEIRQYSLSRSTNKLQVEHAGKLAECLVKCINELRCSSYHFKTADSECTLFTDRDVAPILSIDRDFYGGIGSRSGVNCYATAWSSWSRCEGPCGAAVQNQTRQLQQWVWTVGLPCGEDIATEKYQTCEHCDATFALVGQSDSNIWTYTPAKKLFQRTEITLNYAVQEQSRMLPFGDNIIIDAGTPLPNNIPKFEAFSPITMTKITLNPYPSLGIASRGACTTIIGNSYYNCLGQNENPVATCGVYTIIGDGLEFDRMITILPHGNAWPCCAPYESGLYLWGGTDDFGETFERTGWKLDLVTETYTALPPHTAPRTYGMSSLWFGDKIVTCAGRYYSATPHQDQSRCFAYDPNTTNYEPFPALNSARVMLKLFKWGEDKILAIGGEGNNANIELYTTASGAWVNYDTLPSELRGPMTGISIGLKPGDFDPNNP